MSVLSTLEVTPTRLRVWGVRSCFSVLDQGFTSGGGFVINLLLARWLAPEVYGAFAVAFAGLLFVSGFHNVLLLEPVSVIGPASYARQLPAYFLCQLKVHAVLVGILSGLILLAGGVLALVGSEKALVGAMLGSGVALPLLLLLWLARRMCYVVQRPGVAVWASILYLALILTGLIALHHRGGLGPLTAFLVVGFASLLASFLVLSQLGVLQATDGQQASPTWRKALRENWKYGRWLVASTALFSAANQTQTFLAAGLLGLGAAGALRAMQMPSLVMTQIVSAAGLLVLPSMAYDFGQGMVSRLRKKATLTSFFLTAMALACVAGLLPLAGQAEHVLYGGKYAAYSWLIPVLGLLPVCSGFAIGYSMALRASRNPQFDLLSNSVSAPVGVLSAVLFIHWWGIGGAAGSMVLGLATYAAVFFWSYRSWVGRAPKASEAVAC